MQRGGHGLHDADDMSSWTDEDEYPAGARGVNVVPRRKGDPEPRRSRGPLGRNADSFPPLRPVLGSVEYVPALVAPEIGQSRCGDLAAHGEPDPLERDFIPEDQPWTTHLSIHLIIIGTASYVRPMGPSTCCRATRCNGILDHA